MATWRDEIPLGVNVIVPREKLEREGKLDYLRDVEAIRSRPNVRDQINRLEKNVALLAEELDALHESLSPILGPVQPTPTDEEMSEATPDGSFLARELHDINDRFNNYIRAISFVRSRIDL